MYKYILSIEIYHESFVVYIHSPSRVVDKSQGKKQENPLCHFEKKNIAIFP